MKSVNKIFREMLQKAEFTANQPSGNILNYSKAEDKPAGNVLNYKDLRSQMSTQNATGTHLKPVSLDYKALRQQFKAKQKTLIGKSEINPKAIQQANAKLAAPAPGTGNQLTPTTHIAGIQLPHELKNHFDSGEVVPQDHPLREKAANFVTQVWRQNQPEGARMSSKLLGIGEDGKMTSPNVKPGYAMIKSERLGLRSLLKRKPNL